jgi:hypothetical protein
LISTIDSLLLVCQPILFIFLNSRILEKINLKKYEIFVENRRENPGGSNLEGGLVEVPEGVPEGVKWGIKMFSSLF